MKNQRSLDIQLPVMARDVLKDAAMAGIDHLEQAIERLRVEYADAFHTKDSLAERGFAHEPKRGEPHRWFVHATVPKPVSVSG